MPLIERRDLGRLLTEGVTAAPERPASDGLAVATLLLGIVGAIPALVPLEAPMALVFGILDFVFGGDGKGTAPARVALRMGSGYGRTSRAYR